MKLYTTQKDGNILYEDGYGMLTGHVKRHVLVGKVVHGTPETAATVTIAFGYPKLIGTSYTPTDFYTDGLSRGYYTAAWECDESTVRKMSRDKFQQKWHEIPEWQLHEIVMGTYDDRMDD